MLVNARSIRSNGTLIRDHIENRKPSIIGLTETWNKNEDGDFFLAKTAPDGYLWCHINREESRGGGLAIIYQKDIKCTPRRSMISPDIEFLWSLMKINLSTLHFVVLYRPPSGSLARFFETFSQLLEDINQHSAEIIITGDFNLHIDQVHRPEITRFLDLLDGFNLHVNVNGPTHISGHTLDLIISRKDSPTVQNVLASDLISDHMSIVLDININITSPELVKREYRSTKNIDLASLNDDMKNCDLFKAPPDDLDILVNQFNETLQTILDKYAPKKTRAVKTRKNPWYNNEIHEQRQLRRKLTRRWHKTRSDKDKENMIAQRDRVKNMIYNAKSVFYQRALGDAGTDSKSIFRIIQELLSDYKSNPLPDVPSDINANNFNRFFIEKIRCLKDRFNNNYDHKTHDGNAVDATLDTFSPVDLKYVTKLIQSAPNKTCDLDPIPTNILKFLTETIAPVVQKIINSSLDKGIVPSTYKTALVKPLLKKPGLEPIHKNYRPVSNLQFVSKLLEQSVIDQLEKHAERNDLDDDLQSAYRPNHSTETALLHVVDSLLVAMDNRMAVLMGMLDLSAAFDTINHDIMLERLSITHGLGESAVRWFASYLRGRTQRVAVENTVSEHIVVEDGAVQGSKIGCRLYKMYVEPLGKLLRKSDCSNHGYADDNTVWKAVNPKSESDVHAGIRLLERTLEDVRTWMFANKLCLNDAKTEYIVFGQKRHVKAMPVCPLKIGEESIQPADKVKNLGVTLDSNLDFRAHISNTVKACRYHIRRAWLIRRYLDEETAKRLMLATVISRLDYCNSLLAFLPDKDIRQLQKVQNSAARLVTLTSQRESITPILKKLHWLPVQYRIQYKIATIVHKCVYGNAPVYLKDLLESYTPSRTLRSSSEYYLVTSSVNQKSLGTRAFSRAGPRI